MKNVKRCLLHWGHGRLNYVIKASDVPKNWPTIASERPKLFIDILDELTHSIPTKTHSVALGPLRDSKTWRDNLHWLARGFFDSATVVCYSSLKLRQTR